MTNLLITPGTETRPCQRYASDRLVCNRCNMICVFKIEPLQNYLRCTIKMKGTETNIIIFHLISHFFNFSSILGRCYTSILQIFLQRFHNCDLHKHIMKWHYQWCSSTQTVASLNGGSNSWDCGKYAANSFAYLSSQQRQEYTKCHIAPYFQSGGLHDRRDILNCFQIKAE